MSYHLLRWIWSLTIVFWQFKDGWLIFAQGLERTLGLPGLDRAWKIGYAQNDRCNFRGVSLALNFVHAGCSAGHTFGKGQTFPKGSILMLRVQSSGEAKIQANRGGAICNWVRVYAVYRSNKSDHLMTCFFLKIPVCWEQKTRNPSLNTLNKPRSIDLIPHFANSAWFPLTGIKGSRGTCSSTLVHIDKPIACLVFRFKK